MKRVIYLSIFILSVSYLLTFQEYGINLWDEGALLNGSLRTMNGESVYRDFSGYPPGRYLVGATLFKIFGVNISVIRTAVTIMTSLSVVMLYSISLRLIPPSEKGNGSVLAFISPILFLASPSVYYNRFYPIFTIFGIYVIYWYLEKETPFRSFCLAISAILSLFFKLEIGISIMVISAIVILLKIPPLRPPLCKGGNGGVGRIKDFTYFSL
ncbi:MAG: glycosyltransferase family 39 protein, partial [Nitrospinota bacterium]